MHAKNLFAYHPLALALCLSSLPLSTAFAAEQPATAAPGGALMLEETSINAKAVENPTGHVSGPVAMRSTSASKTDAAIKEIPQSVSIITRDEMDQRKADTLAEAQDAQQDRREAADRVVTGHESDQRGRYPHHQQRSHQGRFTADPVAEVTEQERADRARDERNAERDESR